MIKKDKLNNKKKLKFKSYYYITLKNYIFQQKIQEEGFLLKNKKIYSNYLARKIKKETMQIQGSDQVYLTARW